MSISAPRHAAAPFVRRGRIDRTAAVFWHEVAARAGIGMGFVVAFGYATTLLILIFDTAFLAPGSVTLATLVAPFRTPIWPLLLLLAAAAAGAGAIADDLTSRAITLYLSRPIQRVDYLAAKSGAVALWVGMVAVGPGMVGVLLLATLGTISGPLAASAMLSFLGVGLLVTFFFTALSVGLSALSSNRLYAGVGIFGVPLALQLASSAISNVTGNPQVRYLGLFTDFLSLADGAFRTSEPLGTDPTITAALLLSAGVGLLLLAWWKLWRVEVVGE